MKPLLRNVLVFISAALLVTELNARFFNLITLLEWSMTHTLPNFGSYYLGLFGKFLFISIPEILTGLVMPRVLAGKFKIHWCLGLSCLLLLYNSQGEWFMTDAPFIVELITYAAYNLYPITLVIAAALSLKWPNQSFKRDA